jgi:arylsulfatase A-like enzyme
MARNLEELADDLWPALEETLGAKPARDRAPVFLYVHAFDPHNPYREHPDLAAELPIGGAPGVQPPGWQEQQLARAGLAPPPGSDWSAELLELQAERGRYDQEVRYTDEQLRRLMKRLGELGLLEHAVVALVSDHGETLWEHIPPKPARELAESPPNRFFYQKHGAVQFQAVIATPMLLWGAGVPAGVRVERAVENVDLYPTLLELADVRSPAELHGRSLVELMHGRAGKWRQFVFSYSVHGNSVREPATGLKLLMPRGASESAGWPLQLFDLKRDPHERTDLAEQRPEDVRRLVAAYEEWLRSYPTHRIETAEQSRLQGEIDRRRDEALRALGYTELDTGIEEDHQ